jgi:TctA family transporter
MGDPLVFFTRPMSAVLLVMAAALVVIVTLPAISKKRETVFVDEE